ncbi:type II secretion system protein N [Luteimonas sp. A534]
MPAFPIIRAPRAALARLGGADGLRGAVEVCIVVLLAVQIARLAWLLLPPAPLGTLPATAAALAPPRPDRLLVDAFYPSSGPAPAGADVSGLRLFAVRPAQAGGSAILASREGQQRAHAVGSEVAPGLRLAEVHADHVVLDANGRRSELRFASMEGRAPSRPAASPRTATATATEAGESAIDPAQLLAQAGLSPVETGGRVTGYTVIPRGDGAVLRRAGLQAGDVLLSVNGQELTPERYAALADDLAGAPAITLTYLRDGQTRSATLQAKTP